MKKKMNKAKAIEILKEYNMWRKGAGKYAWNDDPSKNANFPYKGNELSEAIDYAIAFMRGCPA